MKYLLEIKEEASTDFIEAYGFKSIGLDERFLERVDVFLKLIVQNPYLFPCNNLRFARLL